MQSISRALLILMNIISNHLLFLGSPCKSHLQVIRYFSLGRGRGGRGRGGEGRGKRGGGERGGEGRGEERGGGMVVLHIVSDVSNMQDHSPNITNLLPRQLHCRREM